MLRAPKALLALLLPLTLAGSGCHSIGRLLNGRIDWQSRPRVSGELARRFEVLFEGNPLPPATEDKDCKPFRSLLPQSDEVKARIAELRRRHGEDCRVWLYELIDLDGDEMPDWFWNEKHQVFSPLDDDIDGDGTENVLDADPYDPKVTQRDSDGDRIPDHLDWSHGPTATRTQTSPELARLQSELHEKTGAIAVHLDSRHDVPTLRAFIETIQIAYGAVLETHHSTFPTVRFFGAQKGKSDSKVLAYFQPARERIVFMDLARKPSENPVFGSSVPIEVYSTAVHELAHAFQDLLKKENADRDVVQADLLNQFWNGERFRGATRDEWSERIEQEISDRIEETRRTRNMAPIDEVFDSKNGATLSMCTTVARENGILSNYSLKSPGEYFAESAAGYVMNQVFSKRYAHVTPAARREALERNLYRLLEARDGLQAANITSEAQRYFEDRLHLGRDLRFGREARRRDGFKGQWVRGASTTSTSD
jgi:hypothetical protein